MTRTRPALSGATDPTSPVPRRRRGLRAALPTAAVAGVLLVGAFAPAYATPSPGSATGATAVTLGGKAYTTLQAGACGTLQATGVNGVTVTVLTKGLRLTFPVSGVVTQPDNPDALRIDHTGSVTLENACYSITLAGLRITNFGLPDQATAFDLSAVTKSADDSGRQVVGTLDLSTAQVTWVTSNKVRVSQMTLLTSDEGAEELNELATGLPTGPFVSGEKIGSARTKIVFG